MKRIALGWRSLGRTRQFALVLLLILVVMQATMLVARGQGAFVPALGIVAMLGVILIHQSSSARSVLNLATARKKMLQDLRRMGVEAARSSQTASKLLDSVRQEIEHTQTTLGLLGDQSSSNANALSSLQRVTQETLSDVRRSADATAAASEAALARIETVGSELHRPLTELQASVEATLSELRRGAVATTAASEAVLARIDGIGQELHAAVNELEASAGVTLTDVRRGVETSTNTLKALRSTENRIARAFDGGNSHSLERRIVAEVSALTLIQPSARTIALPPIDGWAMSPLALHFIESEASKLSAGSTVVELGSGVSTAWIALAMSHLVDPPHIVAVEHDRVFAARTTQHLIDLDVSEYVTLALAPLEPLSGTEQQWYRTDWVEEVNEIGLLIVDGPPAGTHTNARFPALPLLFERLADRATIFVDDADRPGESGMIEEWLKMPGVQRGRTIGRSLVLDFVRQV